MPEGLAATNFEAVEIRDYDEVGKVIIRWMRQGVPIARHGPIQQLIDAINDEGPSNEPNILTSLPSSFGCYQIFDGSDDVFQFRMPPPLLTEAGHMRACVDLKPGDPYGAPDFYEKKICNDDLSHCDFFLSRVADYTMNMCR